MQGRDQAAAIAEASRPVPFYSAYVCNGALARGYAEATKSSGGVDADGH